jgi:integrase
MTRTAIAPGVYVDDQGRYWARPRIHRRSTWRLLKDPAGRPIAKAKTAVALALNTDWTPAGDTFALLARLYLDAGCPNKRLEQRPASFVDAEKPRVTRLISYFGPHPCDEIRLKLLPAYAAWRKRHCHRGTGERTVDLDLATLSNVLNYGVALGQLEMNWIAHNRPRYRKARDVRHSRVLMPASADVIHAIAGHLFARPQSEVCGWLVLFAYRTGCRTSELLRLRLDAKPGEAGYCDHSALRTPHSAFLHLGRRSKNGLNPWVEIAPDLAQLLECFHWWHAKRYPKSKVYFPCRLRQATDEPVDKSAAGKAMARACRELQLPHTTPHALRAYYVTKRRRDGVHDSVVAAEIGDATVSLISTTYGDTPGGEKLSWLPTSALPAWLKWQPQQQKVVNL